MTASHLRTIVSAVTTDVDTRNAFARLLASTTGPDELAARLWNAVTIAQCGGIDARTLETLLHLAAAQQVTPTLATKLAEAGIDITPPKPRPGVGARVVIEGNEEGLRGRTGIVTRVLDDAYVVRVLGEPGAHLAGYLARTANVRPAPRWSFPAMTDEALTRAGLQPAIKVSVTPDADGKVRFVVPVSEGPTGWRADEHPDPPTHAPVPPGLERQWREHLNLTEDPVTPNPRTAADLTPADVGRDVTLTGHGWAVSGPLRVVHTDTEYVEDQSFADPDPAQVPTRTTTTVTVGPWTATLTQPGAVTVEDTRP